MNAKTHNTQLLIEAANDSKKMEQLINNFNIATNKQATKVSCDYCFSLNKFINLSLVYYILTKSVSIWL